MTKLASIKNFFYFLSVVLIGYIFFLVSSSSFDRLNYIYLHIDERQLIDDIYNVYFFNDEFGRFDNLQEGFLKKTLIFFTEILLGGNLDYGRIWNNIFVLFCAPFFSVNNTLPILIERFVVIILFSITFIFISIKFIEKKNRIFFVIFCFSFPSIFYILNPPKPDILMILAIFIATNFIFFKDDLNKGFIFFGIAIGVKITALIPAFATGILLIYPFARINTFRKFLLANFYTLLGTIIAQPAILLPVPGLQKRIINSVLAASKYDQSNIASQNIYSLDNWINTLAKFYNLNSWLIIVFFVISFAIILKNSITKIFTVNEYFLVISMLYLLIFFLFIDRNWLYYLILPFIYLNLYIFRSFKEEKIFLDKFFIFIFFILVFSGIHTNLLNIQNRNFVINNYWENNLLEALEYIDTSYIDMNNKNYLVLWDPEYYFPKNKITYLGDYEVIENWQQTEELQPLFENADFIVTTRKFNTDNYFNVKIKIIGDLYIYSLN